MKTYDIISIGSATQDTYVSSSAFRIVSDKHSPSGRSECFAFGTKIELEDFHLEVGGAATNTAATFSHWGLKSAVVATIGDDPSGEYILQQLRRARIDTRYITIIHGGKSAYGVFFLGKNGERTILVYRGVSGSIKPIDWRKINARWLYVSSLGGNKKSLQHIFSVREQGTNIAWNPGKQELALGLRALAPHLSRTDVLFLNKEEAAMFSVAALRKQVRGILAITDAEKGSRIFVGSKVIRVRIRPVKAKDTTGAGDAFGSGFVASLICNNGDIAAAAAAGSANAMSEVLVIGAKNGLGDPSRLKRFYSRISLV